MVNINLRHNLDYTKYNLFDVTKFILVDTTVIDTTVIVKDKMLNEHFKFRFKINIKWNLTKSHATRLESDKYKTHVIKEQLLK